MFASILSQLLTAWWCCCTLWVWRSQSSDLSRPNYTSLAALWVVGINTRRCRVGATRMIAVFPHAAHRRCLDQAVCGRQERPETVHCVSFMFSLLFSPSPFVHLLTVVCVFVLFTSSLVPPNTRLRWAAASYAEDQGQAWTCIRKASGLYVPPLSSR